MQDNIEQRSPRVSVIIPSHFRPKALRRVLEGLSGQTVPSSTFEVIVVLDGGCAESKRMLDGTEWSFRLRVFPQPQRGASAARNRALHEAGGDVVLALDDDVIPTPQLLERHLRWHEDATDLLVFGTFLLSPESPEPIVQAACDWSGVHRQRMMQIDDEPSGYSSLVVDGNMSAGRAKLLALGGWDEKITGVGGSDDLDLAQRWVATGYRLRPDPSALGEHFWCKSWSEHLRDQRNIGRAHHYLSRKSPQLSAKLDHCRITSRSPLLRAAGILVRWTPTPLFGLFSAIVQRFGVGTRRRYAGLVVALIRVSGVMYYLRGYAEGYLPDDARSIAPGAQ